MKKVAVIGKNATSERLVSYLKVQKRVDFYGWLVHEEDMFSNEDGAISKRLEQELKNAGRNLVKTLYITFELSGMAYIGALIWAAENQFMRINTIPDLCLIGRYNISYIDREFATVRLRSEPLEEIGNRLKKCVMDVKISGLGIVFLLSWLYPLIAVLIKVQSNGPVLFRQLRGGRDDKPFYCLKFRSMQVNPESDSLQATRTDGRITKVGRFLRRTSLDKLPQFFNVFNGEMSLVGPRPHMLNHTREYTQLVSQFMIRHFLKPGISGWAQVIGYWGETDGKKTWSYASNMINGTDNRSRMLDLKIIFGR